MARLKVGTRIGSYEVLRTAEGERSAAYLAWRPEAGGSREFVLVALAVDRQRAEAVCDEIERRCDADQPVVGRAIELLDKQGSRVLVFDSAPGTSLRSVTELLDEIDDAALPADDRAQRKPAARRARGTMQGTGPEPRRPAVSMPSTSRRAADGSARRMATLPHADALSAMARVGRRHTPPEMDAATPAATPEPASDQAAIQITTGSKPAESPRRRATLRETPAARKAVAKAAPATDKDKSRQRRAERQRQMATKLGLPPTPPTDQERPEPSRPGKGDASPATPSAPADTTPGKTGAAPAPSPAAAADAAPAEARRAKVTMPRRSSPAIAAGAAQDSQDGMPDSDGGAIMIDPDAISAEWEDAGGEPPREELADLEWEGPPGAEDESPAPAGAARSPDERAPKPAAADAKADDSGAGTDDGAPKAEKRDAPADESKDEPAPAKKADRVSPEAAKEADDAEAPPSSKPEPEPPPSSKPEPAPPPSSKPEPEAKKEPARKPAAAAKRAKPPEDERRSAGVRWKPIAAMAAIAVVSFVAGLAFTRGPLSGWLRTESDESAAPSESTRQGAPSPTRAAEPQGARGHGPTETAASPGAAGGEPTPAVEPDDDSPLRANEGWLVVQSKAQDLYVYALGKPIGRVNTKLRMPCGMTNVRLGDHPLENWHSNGRPTQIVCQSVTRVSIETVAAQPVGEGAASTASPAATGAPAASGTSSGWFVPGDL